MKKLAHPNTRDIVVQANTLVKSIYSLPALEKKLVMLAYSKIKKGDTELPDYTFDRTEVARILGREKDGNYEWLKSLCESVGKRPLTLPKPEGGWIVTNWLTAEYKPRTGEIVFTCQAKLRDYFLDLKNQFTIVPLELALRLTGKYSIRILELVLQWQGTARNGRWVTELEIAELREMFMLNDSYKTTKEFKRNVIDRAVEEINLSDIGLTSNSEPVSRGRFIVGFKLTTQLYQIGVARATLPPTADDLEIDDLSTEDKTRYLLILADLKRDGELIPLAGYETMATRDAQLAHRALEQFKTEKKTSR